MLTIRLLLDVLTIEGLDIPSRTILRDVKDSGDGYVGLWCSCMGSYHTIIPHECAEVVPADTKTDSQLLIDEIFNRRKGVDND